MELIYVPEGWREVPELEFGDYLKQCPDYTRRSYTGSALYSYKYSGQNFAVIKNGKVYVRPELLKES